MTSFLCVQGSPVKTNSRTEDGRRHNRCVVYKIIADTCCLSTNSDLSPIASVCPSVPVCLSCRGVVDGVTAPPSAQSQVTPQITCFSDHQLQISAAHVCLPVCPPQRGGGAAPVGVERMRREAQHAALRYDEERHKSRSQQRDSEVRRTSSY